MTSTTTKSGTSSTAFALSLASGVIIILGGILPWILFANFQASPMGSMMGGMMGYSWGSGPLFMAGGWLFPLPLVTGTMVLFGAIMMNARPYETRNWGTIVLVFSVIGLVGMGLSTLGGIIGIVAGAVALSTRNGR